MKYHCYTYAGLGGITRWDGDAETAGEAAVKAAEHYQIEDGHRWTVVPCADGQQAQDVLIDEAKVTRTYKVAGYDSLQ